MWVQPSRWTGQFTDLWRCDPCYEHTVLIPVVHTLENADTLYVHLGLLCAPLKLCSPLCAPCTEYIALYPYSSSEPGDLTFLEGEEILVTQKEGEWWTGSIDTRTGIFPSNYVRPKDPDVSSVWELTVLNVSSLYSFLHRDFEHRLICLTE